MTTTKIYDEYIEVDQELDEKLKECLINHLTLYNYSLSILQQDEECNFKKITKKIKDYITANKIELVLHGALMNELYYQYKKYKRNIKMQKSVVNIQYFTFISNGYKCKGLKINEETNQIKIANLPGQITILKKLPNIEDSLVYINLSYSNTEQRYKINIYLTN